MHVYKVFSVDGCLRSQMLIDIKVFLKELNSHVEIIS
jgi:hypothetical protein